MLDDNLTDSFTTPVLLDGFDVSSCPVKIQHRYLQKDLATVDQSVRTTPNSDFLNRTVTDNACPSATDLSCGKTDFDCLFSWWIDQVDSSHLARQSEYLSKFLAEVTAVIPDVQLIDLRSYSHRQVSEQNQLALQAVADGADYILSPWFPTPVHFHLGGRIDGLVRVATTNLRDSQGAKYLPIILCPHRILEQAGPEETIRVAKVEQFPSAETTLVSGWKLRENTEPVLLRAAHGWQILSSLGLAAETTPASLIVSTDTGAGLPTSLFATVVGLSEPKIKTFAKTAQSSWRYFSPLERLNHELEFRVKVAEVAQKTSEKLMVYPIYTKECDDCPWWQACLPQLKEKDLSIQIDKAPLDTREITVLWGFGICSTADLANADLESLLEKYLPLVQHRAGGEKRLRAAHRRSKLIEQGIVLERISTQPIELPTHDLEIDFDIETSDSGRVYLWGFWVTDHSSGKPGYYKYFAQFKDLDEAGEIKLASQACDWLIKITAGRDAQIYHYSDYELIHLRNLAKASHQAAPLKAAVELCAEHATDLFQIMRQNFFGVHGLGLKKVAQSAAGFFWHDVEASGLNSQYWFNDAVHSTDPQVRESQTSRVLVYNQDDTMATKALRDWLRTNPGQVFGKFPSI